MHPEQTHSVEVNPLDNIKIHPRKQGEVEARIIITNATTSTPAATLHNKTASTNVATTSTANGGHSPSLVPVSVHWLGQNPNLLGKFIEYYKV